MGQWLAPRSLGIALKSQSAWRGHQIRSDGNQNDISKRLKGLYPDFRCIVFRLRDSIKLWNLHRYRSLGTVHLSKVSITPQVESGPGKKRSQVDEINFCLE